MHQKRGSISHFSCFPGSSPHNPENETHACHDLKAVQQKSHVGQIYQQDCDWIIVTFDIVCDALHIIGLNTELKQKS